MIHLDSTFLDFEVFAFLRWSLSSHPPWRLLEPQKPILPHAKERMVRIVSDVVNLAEWLAYRVCEIIEFASSTGEVVTYTLHKWFCLTPETPLIQHQMTSIIMHNPWIKWSPPARFSWPVLIQPHPDRNENKKNAAKAIMNVLSGLGRSHPKVHPDSIQDFRFSGIDSK